MREGAVQIIAFYKFDSAIKIIGLLSFEPHCYTDRRYTEIYTFN